MLRVGRRDAEADARAGGAQPARFDEWLGAVGKLQQKGWSARVERTETGRGTVSAFSWHGREILSIRVPGGGGGAEESKA